MFWKRAGGQLAVGLLAVAASWSVARAEAPYLIGRGMTDITGPPVGIRMLGYVRPEQITAGIHLRQYSRAFVIAQPDGAHRLAIVTTDLQSVTLSLVLSVLDDVRKELGDEAYRLDNTIIAATHTHAVPGGYWHNGSDTPLGSPFNPEHFEAIASGIAASIVEAHRDLAPGHIRIAVGDVEGGGAQRSRTAYLQNPEEERSKYPAEIDTQMILLRFERDGQPIGILNWHAVHPTSMSYHNRLISSDNKGYAAYAFERWWKTKQAAQGSESSQPFVAAFAQSNCGDVTPNLTLKQRGPGKDEFDSTRIMGDRQCQAAIRLFESAGEELSGPVDSRQAYVDFGHLVVRDEWTGCGDQTTGPAAYGYSFAAGSTEDGGGQTLLFKEGMTKTDKFIETLAKQVVPLPRPSEAVRTAHLPKPILFAPGTAEPPYLPNVIPVGVARIGQLALAVGPAEFTTMSGRRFRTAIQRALPEVKYVAIAGYANDYVGYVATREEYEVQHYEGAATLYGPWTQAGYQQEFARLAADIAAGRPSATHEPPPDVRGTIRPTPLGTSSDEEPAGASFGDVAEDAQAKYAPGELATAVFWTGHPQNNYRPDRPYATIERQDSDAWHTVTGDGDWEVKVRFSQPPDNRAKTAPHLCRVEWEIPADAVPGTYRIVHCGVCKPDAEKPAREFKTVSRTFEIKEPAK